jgi:hypothetical protein
MMMLAAVLWIKVDAWIVQPSATILKSSENWLASIPRRCYPWW